MNEKIKVSVVIPIYNSEFYLKRCLDSVCGQTLKEIEIICVDDGSTDSSRSILNEYAEKDSRFTILEQKNQYAGVARNNGMRYASGEYLMFWDSDDFFEADALKNMYERCVQTEADVCICGVNNYYTSTNVRVKAGALLNMKYVPDSDTFSVNEMGDNFFRFTTLSIWNKMVRRDFLLENNIWFLTTRNAEDIYFTFVVLYLAKRVTVVDEILVNYRKLGDDSLSFSVSEDAFSIIEACTKAYDRIRQEGIECKRSFANRALASLIGMLHTTADYEAFCDLVSKLKEAFVLDKMGIVKPERDFYFQQSHSDWLEKLLCLEPKEFHKYFYITTFRNQLESIQMNQGKVRHFKTLLHENELETKAKLREKNEKIRNQKEKLSKQAEKISKQAERISKQAERISKQKTKLTDLENQLAEIKKSRSYRFSQKIGKMFGV